MKPQKEEPGRSRSPGNEGSRGSHGVANRGAQDAEGTRQRPDATLPDEGKEDLRRDPDAEGGGGISSNSSRAKDA